MTKDEASDLRTGYRVYPRKKKREKWFLYFQYYIVTNNAINMCLVSLLGLIFFGISLYSVITARIISFLINILYTALLLSCAAYMYKVPVRGALDEEYNKLFYHGILNTIALVISLVCIVYIAFNYKIDYIVHLIYLTFFVIFGTPDSIFTIKLSRVLHNEQESQPRTAV